MSNDIEKLRKLITFARASAENDDLPDLAVEMRTIKDLLTNVILMLQTAQLNTLMKDMAAKTPGTDLKKLLVGATSAKTSAKSPLSRAEALDNLETIATTKSDVNGARTFLLHRVTEDFEYAKCAEKNVYETTQDTVWIVEIEKAESAQKSANPVISCWFKESDISKIEGQSNTGVWGELGKNPHSFGYKVTAKPGKYEIYRELRQ